MAERQGTADLESSVRNEDVAEAAGYPAAGHSADSPRQEEAPEERAAAESFPELERAAEGTDRVFTDTGPEEEAAREVNLDGSSEGGAADSSPASPPAGDAVPSVREADQESRQERSEPGRAAPGQKAEGKASSLDPFAASPAKSTSFSKPEAASRAGISRSPAPSGRELAP